MKRAPSWAGLRLCPANPGHGPLIAIEGVVGFVCINQEHDGRPLTHPLGEAPQTRSRWSLDELAS